MNAKELERLLEKYNLGECSVAEKELLQSLLDQLDRKDLISANAQKRLLSQVKNRLNKQVKPAADVPLKVFSLWKNWSAVAAMVLICFTFFLLQKRNVLTGPAYTVAGSAKPGQLIKVILPDSSKVWLNSASRILIRSDFNAEQRDVTLEGEAFFEVAKNKHKPFIIHTGILQTRVLGTSFNVQAYHQSSKIEVTLKTGKVWISAGNKQQAILLPGDMISYAKASRHLGGIQKIYTQNADAWRTGRLIFNDNSLQEVVEKLGRAYDLNIRIKTRSLQERRINGEFDMREAPQEVLDNICHLIGVRFSRKGRLVTIE